MVIATHGRCNSPPYSRKRTLLLGGPFGLYELDSDERVVSTRGCACDVRVYATRTRAILANRLLSSLNATRSLRALAKFRNMTHGGK